MTNSGQSNGLASLQTGKNLQTDYDTMYVNMLEDPYIMLLILTCKFLGSIGSSLVEQAECIFRAYTEDSVADDLYLIFHNVDGPMLRNEVSQGILSR